MNKSVKKEVRAFLLERGIRISKKKYKYYFTNWERLSSFTDLPEDFLEKYEKKINWLYVSFGNRVISDRFIYENKNRLYLEYLIAKGVTTQKRLDHIEFLDREEVISRFELMDVRNE